MRITSAPCSDYRAENPRDPHFLQISFYLLDYPFANRLFPGSLDVIEHLRTWGPTVILSDGDVVFQPRKIERSGLFEAVEGHVLIYIHKERELDRRREALSRPSLRPGGRQASHPDRGEEGLGGTPDHRFPAPGALRFRPQDPGHVPARGHHDRAHRLTCSGTTCPPCSHPTGSEVTKPQWNLP